MEEKETRNFLINRRKELGLSQEYVAGQLNISVTSYRKIENGKTGLYNKKVLTLAEILETTPAKLLFGYSIPETNDGMLKEEYERSIVELMEKNAELKKTIRNLEELVKAKDEIISMLKSMKNR